MAEYLIFVKIYYIFAEVEKSSAEESAKYIWSYCIDLVSKIGKIILFSGL